MKNYKELLHQVRCFVFDIDGVMTDGSLLVEESGVLLRRMNIKDGYALKLAARRGYFIFVISGSNCEGCKKRLEKLGINEVHLGIENKLAKLENLLLRHHVRMDETLYMGDDIPDMEVMQHCLVRTCPADAVPQVRNICHHISEKKGGEGCVRDVIEQVMMLKGHWPAY